MASLVPRRIRSWLNLDIYHPELLSSKEANPPAETTAGADSEVLSHLPEDTQLVMVQQ